MLCFIQIPYKLILIAPFYYYNENIEAALTKEILQLASKGTIPPTYFSAAGTVQVHQVIRDAYDRLAPKQGEPTNKERVFVVIDHFKKLAESNLPKDIPQNTELAGFIVSKPLGDYHELMMYWKHNPSITSDLIAVLGSIAKHHRISFPVSTTSYTKESLKESICNLFIEIISKSMMLFHSDLQVFCKLLTAEKYSNINVMFERLVKANEVSVPTIELFVKLLVAQSLKWSFSQFRRDVSKNSTESIQNIFKGIIEAGKEKMILRLQCPADVDFETAYLNMLQKDFAKALKYFDYVYTEKYQNGNIDAEMERIEKEYKYEFTSRKKSKPN